MTRLQQDLPAARKASAEAQAKEKAENLKAELLSTLITIDQRFTLCAEAGASAADAYDSFYQCFVRAAIAKVQGAQQ